MYHEGGKNQQHMCEIIYTLLDSLKNILYGDKKCVVSPSGIIYK